MNIKLILIAVIFISGCSFGTMKLQQGGLAVIPTESVASYNLRGNGWNWDKSFITDELLKIVVFSDRDLIQYGLDSKQTINAYAYFCGNKKVNYPLNVGLYVEGKNVSHLQIGGLAGAKSISSKIGIDGKSWYSYDVLAVSMFTQDIETPDSEPSKVELYGKYDLRDAHDDLCVMVTGYSGWFTREKSNVLVIKKEEIKRAFENHRSRGQRS